MTLHLYTKQPPSGRCVVLAQQLARATGSGDSVRVAEKLFAGHHPPDKPAVVNVRSREAVEGLWAVCVECGITAEVRDDQSTAL